MGRGADTDGRSRTSWRPSAWKRAGAVALVGVMLGAGALGLAQRLRRDAKGRTEADAARRLIEAGRFEEAQVPLRRWLEAEPTSAEALFLVAKGAIGLGMLDQGLQALERAQAQGYSPTAIDRERALALTRLGRPAQAEPILRKLVRSGRPDPELDQALARCHLETFQLRAAAESIERWIRDAPDDPAPYLWKAQLGRRINASPQELAGAFEQALRLDPDNGAAHLGLGELLVEQNQFDAAQAHFAAALRQAPDDGAANLGMGRALAGLGQEDAALEHLGRAGELAPGDPRPRVEGAKLALRRGRLEEALASLDRAIAIDPYEPEAHYHRSLVLARLGRADEARDETERTARLRREHQELIDLFRTLYDRPGDAELQHRAARWLFEHGRPEEGRRWAEKVLRESPTHAATHALLADYFERRGESGRANYHRLGAGPGSSRP